MKLMQLMQLLIMQLMQSLLAGGGGGRVQIQAGHNSIGTYPKIPTGMSIGM